MPINTLPYYIIVLGLHVYDSFGNYKQYYSTVIGNILANEKRKYFYWSSDLPILVAL